MPSDDGLGIMLKLGTVTSIATVVMFAVELLVPSTVTV